MAGNDNSDWKPASARPVDDDWKPASARPVDAPTPTQSRARAATKQSAPSSIDLTQPMRQGWSGQWEKTISCK